MRSIVITGAAARVKWGYLDAAALSNWTLDNRTISATVQSSDPFRVGQSGLMFVVQAARTVWRWPIETLSVVDGRLTATVGAQEY